MTRIKSISKEKVLLAQAIEEHHLITCTYHGKARVLEPYLFGMMGGKEHLHCYQTAGESESGGIPQWRNLRLDELENLKLIKESYFSIRETYRPWNAHYIIEKSIK
jgi:predicted DNA-binding transcriptional regulator YafY